MALASPAVASQSARLVYARDAEAASCGEESALRQAVARRLGYDPFIAESDNTVVAELRAEGEGLRARVIVIERGNTIGGARELVTSTRQCDELMLAVALAISIVIDPESIDRIVEKAPLPVPEPKAVEASPESAPATKAPLARPIENKPSVVSTPTFLRFGFGGFVATGPTPLPAIGIVGGIDVERGFWSIGLEPRWWAPAKIEPQSENGARAATSLVSLAVVPCLTSRGWYGCYLAEVGRLVSEGEIALPQRDVSVWAAQGLRLAYRVGGQTGFGLSAKLDALVAFTRVQMLLDGRQVFATPGTAARFGLEVSYGF